MRIAALYFAPAAVAGLAASLPGMAQQAPEVIVEAPHLESTTVKGAQALTIVYRVSYADLNLATHTGASELEKRIKDSATKACTQLQKLYATSVEPPCSQAAIKNAMAQADKAIAAAEKGAR